MTLFYLGLGFALGVIAACLFMYFLTKDGTLRVDRSDPDGPYLFLEGMKSPYEIAYKRFVILDVKLEDFISHK